MLYKGKTEDAASPFLNESFWEEGKTISGVVLRSFSTKNGEAYVIKLPAMVVVGDTGLHGSVSLGALKGLRMAIAATGLEGLRRGDKIIKLKCTGKTDTGKGNPRVNFLIEIDRPEAPVEQEISDEDIPF